MDAPKTETLPPPPGVIGSLKAGFDTIAVHITAIFLPLLLDLLLWLGPHVSIEKLFQPVLLDVRSFGSANGISASDLNRVIDIYQTILHQLNLLSILRTFPIGITSLMSGLNPLATPLGAPIILQVQSALDFLGWIVLLTLVGWLGGGIYFRWIASLVTPKDEAVGTQAVWQSLILSILWMMVTFALGIPIFLLIYVLFSISPILGQGVLLFLGFLSMWLVVPLFFSAHGIFMRRQNVFASVVSSLQMTRFTLPTSSLFVLSVIMISIGLNFVWSIPPADSWMSLVGIVGHAFITTALLAGSFIYYRDMTNWLQIVFEKLKSQAVTRRA